MIWFIYAGGSSIVILVHIVAIQSTFLGISKMFSLKKKDWLDLENLFRNSNSNLVMSIVVVIVI